MTDLAAEKQGAGPSRSKPPCRSKGAERLILGIPFGACLHSPTLKRFLSAARRATTAGIYGAAGAGVTFVGGGQVATLQNQNGVVLRLSGGQVGFQVSLGLAGMTLAMQ